MLYHKNGVITEDRFKNMTAFQWIFHYFEIQKYSTRDKKLFLEKLDDLDSSIQAFYLLVNKENGSKLIDKISDIRIQRQKDRNSKNSENSSDGERDILSDEDKELLAFMEAQPLTMKETVEMRNVGRFILPKKNIKDLKDSKAQIVDSIDEKEKPKLGF